MMKAMIFLLNFKAIASGWTPPFILPYNLKEFPSALFRNGKAIIVKFYDPEVYFIHNAALALFANKQYDRVIAACTKGLAIQNDTVKAEFLELRSKSYYLLKRLEEANEDFTEYKKITGKDIVMAP